MYENKQPQSLTPLRSRIVESIVSARLAEIWEREVLEQIEDEFGHLTKQ